MEEVCEKIPSQKGKDKINVHGYLMVKDKNRKDSYYWCCEFRKSNKCKGRAVTKIVNKEHILTSFGEHNHAPCASAASVAKIRNEIKIQAKSTRDKPIQIIQSINTFATPSIVPCLPSKNALRKTIKRIRRCDRPPEPMSLLDIDIPPELMHTLNGGSFLYRDSTVEEDQILIFTSDANMKRLSKAPFRIMDCTFKTVPILFYQMYTIHAPVVHGNRRVFHLCMLL